MKISKVLSTSMIALSFALTGCDDSEKKVEKVETVEQTSPNTTEHTTTEHTTTTEHHDAEPSAAETMKQGALDMKEKVEHGVAVMKEKAQDAIDAHKQEKDDKAIVVEQEPAHTTEVETHTSSDEHTAVGEAAHTSDAVKAEPAH